MIKTELSKTTKKKQAKRRQPDKSQLFYPIVTAAAVIVILVITGYIYHLQHQQHALNTNIRPLSSTTLKVSGAKPGYNQADNTSASNLSSGSVNLQNNVTPTSGLNGSTTNNLQNTTPIPQDNYVINVN